MPTSCAHWLHWRCDLSLSAAREKIRVAHALKVLPITSRAFESGSLTYSKVRALTRVATGASEDELVKFALNVSASLVEQHCQQLRNTRPESLSVANRAYQQRTLRATRNQARGVMTVTVELPIEDGELILNTLDAVLAEQPEAADSSTSYRARQADALLILCREKLSGSLRGGIASDPVVAGSGTSSTADRYQIVIHTDESALSKDPKPGCRADLPVESIRRLSCDGTLIPIQSDSQGLPLNIGRKRRTIPTAIKRALWARDRCCRFPGCSHNRFVDAHHVQHWAQGGETKLDNLMLLCGHHHRLVHEGGFQVFVDHAGKQCFRRPDGMAVPSCGFRLEDQVDETLNPSAEG